MRDFLAKAVVISLVVAAGTDVSVAQTAGSDGSGLQEIVVTAQKRPENVNTVPIVMTVLANQDLIQSGIGSTQEIEWRTPGLVFGNTNGFAQPYIRGIGTDLLSPGQDSPVGFYLDGVYLPLTSSLLQQFGDISRVEVLKGPQGTLYGRNSTAGAVNLITNNPTDTFGTGASVEVGNYSLVRTEAELNVPLFTGLDFRTAFFDAQHSGYMSNGGADEDDVGARAKLLWRPVDEVSLLLIGDYAHVGGTGNSEEPISHTSEQFLYWIANNEMKDLPNPPIRAGAPPCPPAGRIHASTA
jgi:iron complex outermembrane receptor protein